MKKIFFLMLTVCLYYSSISQTNKHINDGLYLVDQVVYDTTVAEPVANQVLIHFDADFREHAPEGAIGLLIHTSDFVPLELDEEPLLANQAENKKKLQLTFSRLASEKLQKFTAEHILKQVTLVVNGHALTMHKIREEIRGGKMEITRCSDNACQRIYVTLKDNVKPNK